FESAGGPKWVWTTFSRDQVDLNFQNPDVLIEMLDVLLFYVERGARVIRLDAIAYLWKEIGASCAHLPQTHTVVKLLRDILDIVAPYVLLLSETNVPHTQNISYFGDGWDEAQIVYNFPLPPLVLYTITAGSAAHLTRWAQTLKPVSARTTFLNFTASHDGIGVRPATDICSADEFQVLIDLAGRHGGTVSNKNDQNGNPIPYELNINYFDALNNPNAAADAETEIDRFLVSQSIPLVLMGMPAIYIHSLLGSRGWPEGVRQTGHPRTINREKLDLDQVLEQLHPHTGQTHLSRRAVVFQRYGEMIKIRRGQKAFHPHASQKVLDLGDPFFAVIRTAVDKTETIFAIHNITSEPQTCTIYTSLAGFPNNIPAEDLFSGETLKSADNGSIQLKLPPYRFMWIKF
ncbi:MAG: sugar phosphorylase, partial [Planctomycetes bacterium]|nr:sugar phosphorylase [Planctomycetota bacterium]